MRPAVIHCATCRGRRKSRKLYLRGSGDSRHGQRWRWVRQCMSCFTTTNTTPPKVTR